MRRIFTLLTLLSASAFATELRIYPQLAEIREKVSLNGSQFDVQLPPEIWQAIRPQTLMLHGVHWTQSLQRQVAPLTSFEGKELYWRDQKVILVRAADLLVQNEAGQYFHVSKEDLRYGEKPPLPSKTMSFQLSPTKANTATLSYLTESIHWQPRYVLQANNANQATLQAWAELHNNLALPYKADAVELYSGDIQLIDEPTTKEMPLAASISTRIADEGDLRGLHKYTIGAIELAGHSVLTLPFAQPQLNQFQRFYGTRNHFSPSFYEGNLDRFYRLKANTHLPAGPITVRENGRFIGQAMLPETRKGRQIQFSLGDSTASYQRTIQTVGKSTKNGQILTTYKVTYTLKLNGASPATAEITETLNEDFSSTSAKNGLLTIQLSATKPTKQITVTEMQER